MSFRRAAIWSLIYVVLALLFGLGLGLVAGWSLGAQFLAGYVVEKSLSVDNLFVFVIIMSTLEVPRLAQPRALTIGIAVALVLRALLIAAGAAMLEAFAFTFLLFGLVLIATAVRLFRHRGETPSVRENPILRFARRRVPMTATYRGRRVLVREGGRLRLTPLFLALIALGTTDLVFALDSIPAVYGVTSHPLIVLAANVFALLGLRALFFVVAGLLDRLVYLTAGLAMILAFVGVKLILHFAHSHAPSVPELSTGLSLGIIVAVLAITTVASLRATGRDPRRDAAARRPPRPAPLPDTR